MYIFICVATLIIFLIGIYQKKKVVMCESKKKLCGKTVLVTDGSTGVGFEIAKDIARRGGRVIIAGPYEMEGIKALVMIAKDTGNHKVYFKLLNLSSQQSVRDFATKVLKSETGLDVLINNAGVGIAEDISTEKGMHFVMEENFYGNFLLTHLLLPLLMKTGTKTEPSRIINITSNIRKYASLDVESYNNIGFWPKIKVYSNRKLSLIMFSRELAKKLLNCNVVVNCAIPSVVGIEFFYWFNKYIAPLMNTLILVFCKTTLQEVQTAIHMTVDDKAGYVSGKVFENCEVTDSDTNSDDDRVAKKLWKQAVDFVKLDEEKLNTF